MDRQNKKRIDYLDSLRAIATILVCLGHVLWYLETKMVITIRCKTLIYLFHMPLFFVLSGMTYEMFTKRDSIQQLKHVITKRIINLVIPVIFMMTVTSLVHGKNQTIFSLYQNGWFLVFLALFLLINGFMDYFFMKGRDFEKIIFFLALLAWLTIGMMELFLLKSGKEILAKFSCEIAKFFGYLICFLFARRMARYREKTARFGIWFYSLLVFSVLAMMTGIIWKLDANGALIKIICGFPVSIVLVELFRKYRTNCSRIGIAISKYSLEIYLIHWNIIHGILLPIFSRGGAETINESLVFAIFLLLVDVVVPTLVGYSEKYIKPIRLIFHPLE